MADRTGNNICSLSEATKHKIKSSEPAMDLDCGPSCSHSSIVPGTDPEVFCFRDSNQVCRPPTPDVESQMSESIFSRAGSISSFGSSPPDFEPPILNRNPVALYSSPIGFLSFQRERNDCWTNRDLHISPSLDHLGPLHSLVSRSIHIGSLGMDSKTAPGDPSPDSQPKPKRSFFVPKPAKRHQTFPPGRVLQCSEKSTRLAFRRKPGPAAGLPSYTIPCLEREEFFPDVLTNARGGVNQQRETECYTHSTEVDTRGSKAPRKDDSNCSTSSDCLKNGLLDHDTPTEERSGQDLSGTRREKFPVLFRAKSFEEE